MVAKKETKTYIFLDESGKPEIFSSSGKNLVETGHATSWLILAAIRCDDYKEVRKRFYEFINTLDIKIDVIAVDKLKTYSVLQRDPGRLYGVMAGQLLKDQLHRTETEVIFSRKDSKLKLQKELNIEVEQQRLTYLQKHQNLDAKTELNYFHNPHYSHGGLQVADYVAYAIFHVFENGNKEWYDLISSKIGRIQDICNRQYFTKRNPL